MKEKMTISADRLYQKFLRRVLFRDLSFSLSTGESLAVTGHNGSGKSTLLQILALLRSPVKGTVSYYKDGVKADDDLARSAAGFCSPALSLYEDLTVYENLAFVCGGKDRDFLMAGLEHFQLNGHENKQVRHCSSGMKQRLKFLCSSAVHPAVLFLDEPGSNLDMAGRDLIYSEINAMKENTIIILATNEEEEARLCSRRISLD